MTGAVWLSCCGLRELILGFWPHQESQLSPSFGSWGESADRATGRRDDGCAPPAAYVALVDQVSQFLPNAAALILSDYGKGTLNADVCQTLIGKARTGGLPVLVDPNG